MDAPAIPSTSEFVAVFTEARTRTLELIADLTDEQMMGPRLPILNPLLWEIGHLAWFQEKWVLRHLGKEKPIRKDGDLLYDSARVPHDTRWDLPLPSRDETLGYMERVLHRIVERLATIKLNEQEAYFHRLALCHEDMHAEAFLYTRQTLGHPAPQLTGVRAVPWGERRIGSPVSGDAEVPGGTFLLGATPDLPFVFDNEKWAHSVEVRAFRIARTPVTNAEFAAFVEDMGYRRRELWSETGWRWRGGEGAEHPVYWERGSAGRWYHRRFNTLCLLEDRLPVIHVNWYEAEAYCRWAGRRLPTEAEWEVAAGAEPAPSGHGLGRKKRGFPWGSDPPSPERANLDAWALGCIEVDALPDGDSAFACRQMIGNVWEWTDTDFGPYPGFAVDPYKEYSEPWFGTHKVLRGGCWATRSRLIRNTWRNFYTSDRRDVLAGFRTCAK